MWPTGRIQAYCKSCQWPEPFLGICQCKKEILDYSERLLGFEMIVQWFLEKYLIGYCCYETFAELQIQFLFPPWMFKWTERLLKSAKLGLTPIRPMTTCKSHFRVQITHQINTIFDKIRIGWLSFTVKSA